MEAVVVASAVTVRATRAAAPPSGPSASARLTTPAVMRRSGARCTDPPGMAVQEPSRPLIVGFEGLAAPPAGRLVQGLQRIDESHAVCSVA